MRDVETVSVDASGKVGLEDWVDMARNFTLCWVAVPLHDIRRLALRAFKWLRCNILATLVGQRDNRFLQRQMDFQLTTMLGLPR
jgi:hypothetical protein